MAGRKFDQIPQIAVEVGEYRDGAIVMDRRRAHPFDPGGGEGGVVASEIVGGEEQEDAAAGLIADVARLFGRRGAGEQDGGRPRRRAGRGDDTQLLSCSG